MIEYLPILLLLFLLVLGVPVAWALFISGFVGLFYLVGQGPTTAMLEIVTYSGTQNYVFTTIPMFVLMAVVLGESGITGDVFEALNSWTNRIPAGLAISTTIANGGFAALSGSSTAAAASIAKIAVPEMQRFDYSDKLSMGTVAASGTFAMMFPPSIALIIYGILVEESIGILFMAGVVPGVLTLLAYILLILAWFRSDPSIAPINYDEFTWKERFSDLRPLWPAIALILLVLGSIYGGIVTPTESGGLGAAGAVFISLYVFDLSLNDLIKALKETSRITIMIYMIILGAMLFTRYLSLTGITRQLIDVVGALPISRWFILFIVLFIYLVLGMFMNQSSVLVLTLPITYPLVVTGLGFDPIWFGILVVKAAEIGMITPPLGLNVYVATSVVDVGVDTAFRGAVRFMIADIVIMILLLAFPLIALWLPATMG